MRTSWYPGGAAMCCVYVMLHPRLPCISNLHHPFIQCVHCSAFPSLILTPNHTGP